MSGFEAGLAVFICAHRRVVLGSFVFLFCLSSVLVRTAGCLSLSPSLVLAEALHVGFFFFYFSSLAIHSASFVSSVLLDDVASCRLEFYKSRLSVCTVCRWLELGGYVQCDIWRSGQDDASTRALQCQSTSVGVVVVSPLSHRSKKWPP